MKPSTEVLKHLEQCKLEAELMLSKKFEISALISSIRDDIEDDLHNDIEYKHRSLIVDKHRSLIVDVINRLEQANELLGEL